MIASARAAVHVARLAPWYVLPPSKRPVGRVLGRLMDVRCDRCQTEYELEDDSVAERRRVRAVHDLRPHVRRVARASRDLTPHARPDDRDGGARLGADDRGRQDPPVPRSDDAAEVDRRASRRPERSRHAAGRQPRAGWATWTSCGRSSIWWIRPIAPRRRAVARPTAARDAAADQRGRRARLRVARLRTTTTC